ncbi:protein kinase-like domain, concanavalin A-like lectin/glucanase domain protein [Tanacetum coccineum]
MHYLLMSQVKNIERLRIDLKDIQLATGDFSSNGENKHVQLECFDRDYIPSVKGMNETEIPKKLYTVRIKHMEWAKASYSEVEIASSCKHHNIQPLLGFCDEESQIILVYKYISDEKLLRGRFKRCTLTWEQRLKICIDVAQGLHYLHYEMEGQKMVIHNDISTRSIVLDDNRGARIVGFKRSVFLPLKQDEVAFDSKGFYKDNYYIDPEYKRSKKLRRESDVFSFGVVMSEILIGKTMHEVSSYFYGEPFAREWFDKGIIKKKICPALKETYSENNFILQKGPNEDSLDTFIQIMYECLAPTHTQRPTMKVVIAKLEKALSLQENYKDTFRMLYGDIELATENFSRHNYVGGGGFGGVYKGEIARGKGHQAIVAKRLDTRYGQGEEQYYNELQILCRYKHDNVIGLVGYSNETRERVIVYEHASRGSLDSYLNDARLTWKKRLNICIDVASGLAFLHGDAETGQEVVIHRDIKTPNILLFDDWKAKVGDFGLSLITTVYEDKNYIIDHASGTRGYVDPVYEKTRFLTIESDIYSFGVVLFEILCGRSTYPINKHEGLFLDSVKHGVEEGKHDEMVFEAIKKEIVPKSLTTFQMIAYRCLHDDRAKRPKAKEVLAQLKMALEYQGGNNIQKTDVMDLTGNLEDINLKPGGSLNQNA